MRQREPQVDAGLLATQTLSLLLTDVEGSTAMLRRLGTTYAEVLTNHHQVIRACLAAHDGKEIDTQGGAADQLLTELGETVEPLEGRLRDLDRQRLRSAMGAEAFQAEYAAGRGLTSEEVVILASGNRSDRRDDFPRCHRLRPPFRSCWRTAMASLSAKWPGRRRTPGRLGWSSCSRGGTAT